MYMATLSRKDIDVISPSIYQLLVMKLPVWRDDADISDARRLLQELTRNQKQAEIWEAVEPLPNAGCPITSIQAILGHKKLESTLTYSRVNDRTIKIWVIEIGKNKLGPHRITVLS